MEYYSEIVKLLGGTTIVLAGLFGFIGKIWLSRIIERDKSELSLEIKKLEQEIITANKRLDAELQHSIFVSQVQFDKEYKVYGEAWANLVELKIATQQLRPMLDHIDPSQTEEDRKTERYKNFITPFNDFSTTMEKNKPFFSLTVYETLSAIRKACLNEGIEYKHGNSSDLTYFDNAEKNSKEISGLIEGACDAIRFRLNEVRVQ